ncbi:MAG: hypothetical protein JNL18_16360 [Planctomycetaceae bacterium]|nr:hypothetical protein [Planctomycetaceae bacterium]
MHNRQRIAQSPTRATTPPLASLLAGISSGPACYTAAQSPALTRSRE